jgi:hypothetical protein
VKMAWLPVVFLYFLTPFSRGCSGIEGEILVCSIIISSVRKRGCRVNDSPWPGCVIHNGNGANIRYRVEESGRDGGESEMQHTYMQGSPAR